MDKIIIGLCPLCSSKLTQIGYCANCNGNLSWTSVNDTDRLQNMIKCLESQIAAKDAQITALQNTNLTLQNEYKILLNKCDEKDNKIKIAIDTLKKFKHCTDIYEKIWSDDGKLFYRVTLGKVAIEALNAMGV